MMTVDVPIKDPKRPPQLTFPDRCVNCAQPKARTLPVKINTGAQSKRGQMVQLAFDVPMCADCADRENKIGNITWIPFFTAGLLTCVIVFIPVWLIAPEGTTLQTYEFPYVLAAFIGMIAGIIIGTLVEFILKIIFAPAYGPLLWKRPLTVLSVLNDSEDLMGLSTRLTTGRKTLKMVFQNEDIAREFIALNPQES
jgi:hypothetical protein